MFFSLFYSFMVNMMIQSSHLHDMLLQVVGNSPALPDLL